MPKLTWRSFALKVRAEMEIGDPDNLIEEMKFIEEALRAFGRITEASRDPDLDLINSFHDLAHEEAERAERGEADR